MIGLFGKFQQSNMIVYLGVFPAYVTRIFLENLRQYFLKEGKRGDIIEPKVDGQLFEDW